MLKQLPRKSFTPYSSAALGSFGPFKGLTVDEAANAAFGSLCFPRDHAHKSDHHRLFSDQFATVIRDASRGHQIAAAEVDSTDRRSSQAILNTHLYLPNNAFEDLRSILSELGMPSIDNTPVFGPYFFPRGPNALGFGYAPFRTMYLVAAPVDARRPLTVLHELAHVTAGVSVEGGKRETIDFR